MGSTPLKSMGEIFSTFAQACDVLFSSPEIMMHQWWPCKHIQIYAIQHKHAYYIALEQLIIPAFEVVTFSTRGGTSGNFDIWVRSRGLIASGGYIELANSRVG